MKRILFTRCRVWGVGCFVAALLAMTEAGAQVMRMRKGAIRVTPSSVNGDTEAPSSVTLSSPDQGETTIDLSWTTATDNVGVTGYEIYVDDELDGTTTSATTYQVTGLSSGTEYSIYVRAKDAAGNGTNSNTITPETDAGGFARDNLVLDADFEGGDPWPTAEFLLSQDNLGVSGNTWARVQVNTAANEGTSCHQIEVRSGCDGCKSSGYRSEMRLAAALDGDVAQNNTVEWYGYSIKFVTPASGGEWTGGSSGHFWQWHPENGSGSATLALYDSWHSNGGWTLAVNPSGGSGADEYVSSNLAIVSDVWHHVVWKIFWGTSNNGYVKVWINGNLEFDETGLDFNTDGQYLKIGMNRWGGSSCSPCGNGAPGNTWILQYDNIRIGNSDATYNDVAPDAEQVIPEPAPPPLSLKQTIYENQIDDHCKCVTASDQCISAECVRFGRLRKSKAVVYKRRYGFCET